MPTERLAYCEGKFCPERESCKRFINGKTADFDKGSWYLGKEPNNYRGECPAFLPLETGEEDE